MRELVQYWHPTRGGWHVGEVIRRNLFTVVVKPLGKNREYCLGVEDVRPIRSCFDGNKFILRF